MFQDLSSISIANIASYFGFYGHMTDTAYHVFWSRFTLNWLSSVAVLQCCSASFRLRSLLNVLCRILLGDYFEGRRILYNSNKFLYIAGIGWFLC